MGYFEISSKRDTDAVPLESRVLIADADIDRITIAYAQLYFPNGVLVPGSPEIPGTPEIPAVPGQDAIPYQPAVPPTLDEDGNVIDPGQPEVQAQDAVPARPAVPAVPGVSGVPDAYRPPTGQEVFDAVAQGLLQGILANTINVEKTNAAKDAQDHVPPIVVEPSASV